MTRSTRAVVAGGLWLARKLEERYDATRQAFAEGAINQAQVRVIVRAAEDLPTSVSPERRAVAEAGLVGKAVNGKDPRRLRQAARKKLEGVSRELADEHETRLGEAGHRRTHVSAGEALTARLPRRHRPRRAGGQPLVRRASPHAWSRGGRTSLANAVPLCSWHHQRAHDDRFSLTC